MLAVSLLYVAAAGALSAGVALRADQRVMRRLRVPPGTSRRTWTARIGDRFAFRLRAIVEERAAELRLDDAGRSSVRGTKVLGAVAGTLLGAVAILVAWGPAVVVAPIVAVAGFRVPDVVLARRVVARRAATAREVPQLLDVLAVSVSAGLSPWSALDRAPEAIGRHLGEELRRARDEVILGLPWRTALQATAERTGSTDLRRLAVTLERSERLGAPVGDRLVMLADEVRSERRARREELARRAPVQMLFPLVFLILPAFVLGAVVPAILVATRGMS
jgi:pilus assembly protein TadC